METEVDIDLCTLLDIERRTVWLQEDGRTVVLAEPHTGAITDVSDELALIEQAGLATIQAPDKRSGSWSLTEKGRALLRKHGHLLLSRLEELHADQLQVLLAAQEQVRQAALQRNHTIRQMVRLAPRRDIADRLGISVGRLSQLVAGEWQYDVEY